MFNFSDGGVWSCEVDNYYSTGKQQLTARWNVSVHDMTTSTHASPNNIIVTSTIASTTKPNVTLEETSTISTNESRSTKTSRVNTTNGNTPTISTNSSTIATAAEGLRMQINYEGPTDGINKPTESSSEATSESGKHLRYNLLLWIRTAFLVVLILFRKTFVSFILRY